MGKHCGGWYHIAMAMFELRFIFIEHCNFDENRFRRVIFFLNVSLFIVLLEDHQTQLLAVRKNPWNATRTTREFTWSPVLVVLAALAMANTAGKAIWMRSPWRLAHGFFWHWCTGMNHLFYLQNPWKNLVFWTHKWRFGRWFSVASGWFLKFHVNFPGCMSV